MKPGRQVGWERVDAGDRTRRRARSRVAVETWMVAMTKEVRIVPRRGKDERLEGGEN